MKRERELGGRMERKGESRKGEREFGWNGEDGRVRREGIEWGKFGAGGWGRKDRIWRRRTGE